MLPAPLLAGKSVIPVDPGNSKAPFPLLKTGLAAVHGAAGSSKPEYRDTVVTHTASRSSRFPLGIERDVEMELQLEAATVLIGHVEGGNGSKIRHTVSCVIGGPCIMTGIDCS